MGEVTEQSLERCRVLKNGLKFDLDKYEYDDRFVPGTTVQDVHTTTELVALLEKDKKIQLEGTVLCAPKKGAKILHHTKVNRESFLAAAKAKAKFREGSFDTWSFDSGGPVVGDDFIPLLSGPFSKQLYYYDYLRMHAASFHAYHHDPVARRVVQLIRDFSLGRGWRVDCDNPAALALWRTFEEVNNLYEMMSFATDELSIYGETMVWELPNMETKIAYKVAPGQRPSKGMIPRVRLIDPSVIWEIVTYPEDITRVLYYQWVAPTQYQMYNARDGGATVPGTKFIYQQIPGDQVMHFKTNCVSNEKRGRSVLFPVLGYMKRLRDSVNWSIIAMQKAAAWSIDTTIEGSPQDIDDYVAEQQLLGTIPDAGSEFVHTSKIKRDYLANGATSKGNASQAFDWCLSMISVGTGIPVNYLGTHLSGGQTRASALVATEPVAKLFETRQQLQERMLKVMSRRLFDRFGLVDAEIEVTFPTVAEQDRSTKLKDLYTAQSAGWISKKRAATIAAKELNITEFEYDEELQDIESGTFDDDAVEPASPKPLTRAGTMNKSRDDGGRQPSNSQDGRRQIAADEKL